MNVSVPFLPPILDDDVRPFWEGCRLGRLVVQRCPDTGRLIFPPRPLSPFGSHRVSEWVEIPGRGSVWSFVIPHPPLLPAFSEVAPYNVIVVALEEDPEIRLVGNLVTGPGGGLGEIAPATIRIGQAVRAVYAPVDEEFSILRWVAEGGPAAGASE